MPTQHLNEFLIEPSWMICFNLHVGSHISIIKKKPAATEFAWFMLGIQWTWL